jgi:uncharacterized membrane protein
MLTVTVYIRGSCPECDQARAFLDEIQPVIPHQIVLLDVDTDPVLQESFQAKVPLVKIGPYQLSWPFSKQDLLVSMGAAQDRAAFYEQVGDETYQKKLERGHKLSDSDRFSNWLSHHYMLLFNFLIFLFVGLPFLAPVLMKLGATTPAKVIYTVYRPFCHEFAFRSWFLFGEQAYYPRQLADIPGVVTYEQATGLSSFDVEAARDFVGNDTLGYKVGICQRDVAMYGSILFFGLVFSLFKKYIKAIRQAIYLWVLVGIVPIAIDGFTQLPSLITTPLPAWLPFRESTPFLRTLTGALFGLMTAYYIYPVIEETMLETRKLMAHKLAIVSQTKK